MAQGTGDLTDMVLLQMSLLSCAFVTGGDVPSLLSPKACYSGMVVIG